MRVVVLAVLVACSGKSGSVDTSTTTGMLSGTIPGEICGNGIDEDGDGLLDCEDDDCIGEPACTELDCTDGSDDDGDGLIDCADEDCWTDPACTGDVVRFVQAGSIERELRRNGVVVSTASGFSCSIQSTTGVTEIWSGTGSIVTGGGTCQWSGSATHIYSASVYRSGFFVQSGCGFSSSSTGFLPSPVTAQFPGSFASAEIVDGGGNVVWSAPYAAFLPTQNVPSQAGQPCFESSEWIFTPVTGGTINLR